MVTVILPPISDEMEASTPPPRPPEDPPEVQDASTLGGWVWVVLFGLVMTLSILANLALVTSVLQSKKKQNVIYALLIVLFGVNIIDYGLLIFEFSLGLEHEYPHGQKACMIYQTISKGNPIVQAAVVLTLVLSAGSIYVKGQNFKLPIFVVGLVGGLAVLSGLLALPTANFAKIVDVEGKKYCEIEVNGGQKEISIYYLVYSAILSYWLPLLLSITPLIRLAKVSNSEKYPEVAVVLATASSFFLFYSLHGCIVLARHSIDALEINIDTYHSWMIKVAQSLLWLVAYFWHVTRPLLAFLMDAELKLPNFCCGHSKPLYDLVSEAAGAPQNNRKIPLKVMISPEVEAEMTSLKPEVEAEMTSLKTSNQEASDEESEQQKPQFHLASETV